MARIGVFVCHCGSNIGANVDCAAVAAAARQMPGVVSATDYKYMCSEPGQKLIQDTIAEAKLDRVVVASCSPRMHELTFRRAVAAAGLNPYLMEMANLREHCSWVHNDRPLATAKAIEIVGMLVAKVARNEALKPGRAELNKRLLVIGGGIAGIQAALDVANAGYQVTLVERTPTIGGKMAMLDKTFPTLDCSACILTPLMVDVAQHPNIELRTYAEIKKVKGFVGNFTVTIHQKARYVNHNVCTGCGTCFNKCPTKDVLSEFDQGLGKRTAIYIPFPQAIPNKPVIDTEHCRYIAYREAYETQVAAQGLIGEAAAKYKPVDADGKKLPICQVCQKMCPTGAIDWGQQDEEITEEFGAIIVANGYDLFELDGSHDAEAEAGGFHGPYYGEYGYGRYPDVISALQLERLMNASGPTKGEIVRPSDGKHPHSVVFIACVGSRDDKVGRPYCSRICCMYTAKQAIMLKEHAPETEAYVFYMDVRAGGRGYDEFVRRAQEVYGTHYLRGRVSRVYRKRTAGGDRYVVEGYDGNLGRAVAVEADLVVLANGVTSARGAVGLMQTLGISYDQYGFINEAHVKLRPVETNTAGIYLAGCSAGPKDIPDTVAQASAAAAKVVGLFARPHIETEPTIAEVDARRCVACHLCEEVCPYAAPTFATLRDGRQVAQINPALCKGCGLCVAGCRGRAIQLHGFSDQQLLAEVEWLFTRSAPLRASAIETLTLQEANHA